jgi:RNA-directed DNA polymerase
VGQGPMPATPADSLLQRQGSCRQTSYDQPRQENTRVDGEIWTTSAQKSTAVQRLSSRGYQPLPLRRVHIPKPGKKTARPLSIPAMIDRGMQALHLLALEPIAEVTGDRNSYGFRKGRSTHDAIGRCFQLLSKRASPGWILDCDVKSCFDEISHGAASFSGKDGRQACGRWL